jgi:hypothetical protein
MTQLGYHNSLKSLNSFLASLLEIFSDVRRRRFILGCTRSAIATCVIGNALVATAVAGERSASRNAPVVVNRAEVSDHQATKRARATVSTQLGRVSFAVDGAESSHGADLAMWRPDPSGPQGPMQVSQAAATDVGGGDRFDLTQNHAIGRTYLAQLYRRYRNWPDAIAAYNWGIGNMDAWVNSGRPAEKLPFGVAAYVRRVLHDSGLCDGAEATAINQEAPAASRARRDDSQENAVGSRACIDVDGRDEVLDGKHRYLYGIALSRSHYQLDKVMLSSQHVTPGAQRSTLGSLEQIKAADREEWLARLHEELPRR